MTVESTDNAEALLNHALELERQDRLPDAAAIYQDLIRQFPGNPMLHKNLGNVWLNMGRFAECFAEYNKSLQLDGNQHDIFCNAGVAYLMMGRHENALAHFNQSLKIKPTDAHAWLNLGNAYCELKRFDEAVAGFNEAARLNPAHHQAYLSRGWALQQINRHDEAVASFSAALEIAPHPEAYCSRAYSLKALGRLEDAAKNLRTAIQLQPTHVMAHSNLGDILKDLGRLEESLACSDTVIRLAPGIADAHSSRGIVLHGLQRLDEALASFDAAIRINPEFAEAHSNRGIVLKNLRRHEEALESYAKALTLRPGYPSALANRGMALQQLLRFEEAMECYDLAIKHRPDMADAYWNKSLLLLMLGRLNDGWKLYEWRLKSPTSNIRLREYPQPRLMRPDVSGRTVLLYAEQGLGDTIHFCRYAKLLKMRGAKVILEVHPPLRELMRTLDSDIDIIDPGTAPPSFDSHSPLLSLPMVFGTDLGNIPGGVPYLQAEPAKSAYWKEKLGEKKKLRVGLVWSSGFQPNQPNGWSAYEWRNVPLMKFSALNMKGISFYSLQKGENAVMQLRKIEQKGWDGPELVDYTDEFHDFSDTAGMIDNLDLIISVDTSTAHLAGAMGKPLWLLVGCNACWRWLLQRNDSPWYPTVKIFRQPAWDDWESVLAQVKAQLAKLVN
jgi:tetratricopeptide (TPR) repeat protein